MQLAISNLQHSSNFSRLFSLISTIAIHGLIVVFMLVSFAPKLRNQQVISISFAAASSQAKNSSSKTDYQPNLSAKTDFPTKNSQAQNNNFNNRKSKENQANQAALTSAASKQDVNSKNSAQTEPLFDAAYLNNPAPIYPQTARQRGIEGKVLLAVLVKANGEPQKVAIAKSSGAKILDEAALAAVLEWRFVPATRFGQNVAAEVLVPIEFKII